MKLHLNNNLSLVLNKKNIFKKKTKYFGLISEFKKKKYKKVNNNFIFHKEKIISKKERLSRYLKCENIFENVLTELTISLNNLHNVKYSKKRWKIILSRWLHMFIYSSYYSYIEIKKIIKNSKIKNTFIHDTKKFDFTTNDVTNLFHSTTSRYWNENLNSKIFEFFFLKKKNYKYVYCKPIKIIKSKPIYTNKNFFIKKIIFFILEKLKNKKTGVFFETFLGFFEDLKLVLFKDNFNLLNCNFNFEYSKKVDFNKRALLSIKKKNRKKNFENFLYEVLPNALPFFAIEDFKKITKLADKLPKNPKFIFTSIGWANEIFNFYIAENVENKIPYIVLQHGNFYFTHIATLFRSDIKDCDYLFTWGAKESNKHIPIFNIRTYKKKISPNLNGNLLIILNNLLLPNHPENFSYINEINLIKTIEMASSLKEKIKKNIFFKLWPTEKNYNNLSDDYLNLIKKKYHVCDSNKSYFDLLKKSKLVLFNYDSTGFYENLTLNFPSILYFEQQELIMNNQYIKYYEILKKSNIFFTDKKKLIKHINCIWDNIDQWWFSSKVQKSISLFNSKLNKVPGSNFTLIKNNIDKILKKKINL